MQNEAARQGFSNLIVLCANHHRVIDDDEVKYTRPALREMKRKHEANATQDFIISDRQAEGILAFLGGAVAVGVANGIARELAEVVRAIADVLPSSSDQLSPVDALKKAPTGVFQVSAVDASHSELGKVLADWLRSAGWRSVRGLSPYTPHPSSSGLRLDFFLPSQRQVPGAKAAIERLLESEDYKRQPAGIFTSARGGYVLSIRFGVNPRM